jgi:L-asparaginase
MHLSLLATGGTISTSAESDGALPRLGAAALAETHGDSLGMEVRSRDVLRVSSRAITPAHMWELAQAVREEIAGGAAGVVITHGTDTLEETAYALAMLVDTTVPVVLTGAMRVPGSPGADGPANVAAAFATAASPEFAGFGPVVVFQDEIHAARWVTKAHSSRVAAFASPAAGPIGYVVEGHAVSVAGPGRSELLSRSAAPAARVELLWAVAGADGMIVEAIGDHVDGLVIAGTGGGHVAPSLAEALVSLAGRGRPIVLSSRCFNPRVLTSTYGGDGSETRLLAAGLRSAGDLAPLKSRLRLVFGLSAGLPFHDLFPAGPAA